MCFLAVQDNRIIAVCESKADAEALVRKEIENDKLKHILKRSIAKKILSGKAEIPAFEDRYCVIEVKDFEEIYRFKATEVFNV